jgi:galactokinase
MKHKVGMGVGMDEIASINHIMSPQGDKLFQALYGAAAAQNKQRYITAISRFKQRFHQDSFEIFSAPGRIEIGGNHTDHNNGKVLAGSVNLDCVGIASKTSDHAITVVSENYGSDFTIDIDDLSCSQHDSTIDLVKGLLEGFQKAGHHIGGFNVYITSNVISAAGISSSAAFEMLLSVIIDSFFNNSQLSKVDYAKAGQYAENHYWDKASGLLDQMSSAIGGVVTIDFADEGNPQITKVDVDFPSSGYSTIIVNTGTSHADLSEEYSSIPIEMKQVAAFFGKKVLQQVELGDILSHVKELRASVSDRAILRAIHFEKENARVDGQVESLTSHDFKKFLRLIDESGDSSWKLLQNCYSDTTPTEQGIPLALTLTKEFISTIGGDGACRVHGGGFAGVILAIIPTSQADNYRRYMEENFMDDSTFALIIRPYGAVNISQLLSE